MKVRTERRKTHYRDPKKPKTTVWDIFCSMLPRDHRKDEKWSDIIAYRELERPHGEAGTSTNPVEVSVGKDGHLSLVQSNDPEHHTVYLYPEQVKFLKLILRRKL